MPKWVEDTIRVIFRMPVANDQWRRFRIACTRQEMDEFKKWTSLPFVRMLKGIPLIIEDDPMNPKLFVEDE